LEQLDVVELAGNSTENEKIVNYINDLNEHFKIKQVHIIESPTKIIYQLR
ncbi:unnamed protein product, partial [Rotaria sp. Silwood2]